MSAIFLPSKNLDKHVKNRYVESKFLDHIYSYQPFFEWQHGGKSTAVTDSSIFCVDEQSGSIVGYLSAWDTYLHCNDKERIMLRQTSNLVINRGFPGLLRSLFALVNECDLTAAANMTERMLVAQYLQGYCHSTVERVAYVYSRNLPFLTSSVPRRKPSRRAKTNESYCHTKVGVTTHSSLATYYEFVSSFGQFNRSIDYYHWRYLEHPIFVYYYMSVRNPVGEIQLIFRRQLTEYGDVFIKIVELYERGDCLGCLTEIFQELDCSWVEFATTNNSIVRRLARCDWLTSILLEKLGMPNKFAPLIDSSNKPQIIATHTSQNRAELDYIYFQSADIDLDRPTKFGLRNKLYL